MLEALNVARERKTSIVTQIVMSGAAKRPGHRGGRLE